MIPIVREASIILLVAVFLAGAGYVVRPTEMRTAPGGSVTDAGGEEDSTISSISLEVAIRHFEKGTALFADARPEVAYRSGHIRGAIHLDPGEFDNWFGDFFSQTPQTRTIITYCEGERCILSLELAEKLTWMGYEKVFYLKNGWGRWKERDLPMEQSSD